VVPDKVDALAERRLRILVSSGGGGTDETAATFKSEVDKILAMSRAMSTRDIDVVQAVGPRLPENAILDEANECVHAGSSLNQMFSQFDLVISTAGYNSVLELAGLDVPVLLVPIARGLDDQMARCMQWAPKLGATHIDGCHVQSALWISETLLAQRRRAAIALDPSGPTRCAELIFGLLQ
jgi:predicted glycosyltransferase